MSLKYAIEVKVFAGRRGAIGNALVIKKTTTGAPNSAAKVGTLCWNSFDEDAYICTVAAGTWVKVNA